MATQEELDRIVASYHADDFDGPAFGRLDDDDKRAVFAQLGYTAPGHLKIFGLDGPNRGGRPPVGTPIQVRLPAAILKRVDNIAANLDMTRAETVRRLVNAGIASGLLDDGEEPQP